MSALPVNMSQETLVTVLTDILERVKAGDSYEGHISWMLPHDNAAPDRSFDVLAGYRVGNLQGQGGMRLIDGGTGETGATEHDEPRGSLDSTAGHD